MAKFDAKNYDIVTFEYRGLPGVIGMHCNGYLSGYVGVPESHCMHGYNNARRTVNVPELIYENPLFNNSYVKTTTCKHCNVVDRKVEMCELLNMPTEPHFDSHPIKRMVADNFYYFGFASSLIPNSAWHPDNGIYHNQHSIYYDEEWMQKELYGVVVQLLVIQSMWSKFKEINDDI